MSDMEWLRQSWLDTLALTEDWMRSKEYQEMAKRPIYRWVEPETIWIDEQGNKHVIPEHQEQGEYIDEANIRGYIIVSWNGKKHLVKESDIVAILS